MAAADHDEPAKLDRLTCIYYDFTGVSRSEAILLQPMAHYRLYRLRADNSIINAVDVDVDSDDDATKRAIEIDHAFIIEVWQQSRLVARVDPGSGAF